MVVPKSPKMAMQSLRHDLCLNIEFRNGAIILGAGGMARPGCRYLNLRSEVHEMPMKTPQEYVDDIRGMKIPGKQGPGLEVRRVILVPLL
ncbi:MAG: hypothetical protein ACYDEQ_02560 [Desulfocucumaceae bacterium]